MLSENLDEDLLLCLNYVFRDSPKRIYELLEICNDFSDLKLKLDDYLASVKAQARFLKQWKDLFTRFDVNAYKEKLERLEIKYISLNSGKYPESLRYIYDPPVILFVKGDLDVLEGEILSVVGARACRNYGEEAVKAIVGGVAGYMTICSGLAKGIDKVAHETALDAGFPTIAVVATGLDLVSPPSHVGLFNRIVKKGVVISEYPPSTTPLPHRFPQRNRIIAGLAKGVLVVEAEKRSGSLITARFAGEFGRDVFAVPGSIFSPVSKGVNMLIQDGAKLIMNAMDILEEYGYVIKQNMKEKKLDISDQLIFDFDEIELAKEEKEILELIKLNKAKTVDEIVLITEDQVPMVLERLMNLEMKGIIKSQEGGRYSIIASNKLS